MPFCPHCESELIDDEDFNKKYEAYGTPYEQLKCPKCCLSWSADNPYIRHPVSDVQMIFKMSFWDKLKALFKSLHL